MVGMQLTGDLYRLAVIVCPNRKVKAVVNGNQDCLADKA